MIIETTDDDKNINCICNGFEAIERLNFQSQSKWLGQNENFKNLVAFIEKLKKIEVVNMSYNTFNGYMIEEIVGSL